MRHIAYLTIDYWALYPLLLMLALLWPYQPAHATPADDLQRLQQQWEQIRYKSPADAQEAPLERLTGDARLAASQRPANADLLIWYAIIESTYAGAKGGLGALSHAKNARSSLEQALAINPDALAGSAYTSLGSLYYQVPGWPIGFGDDKQAEHYLKKGLAINPDGIDSNYFYGDYLFRKGDHAGAARYLNKALQAAPRPGRKLADDGRRGEIAALLEKIAARRP
jgi:tetratricopeptide (TPR) repeat protein